MRNVLQSSAKKEGERRGTFLFPDSHKVCLFSAEIKLPCLKRDFHKMIKCLSGDSKKGAAL